MSLRPVRLPPGVPGTLWLSSMPGRFGSWQAFEDEARQARLGVVVCLTPRAEVCELSPAYEAAIRGGRTDWRWMHLPMPNFGIPEDPEAFRTGVSRIRDALLQGEAVMLHCAAGIGRTGSSAACVLKSLGLPAHDALQRVREAGSNPENARQSGFVDWF